MRDNAPPLPDGMAYTRIVTQEHLNECMRALGRGLTAHELMILEDMLLRLQKYNRKVKAAGMPEQVHSMDELVNIFVSRVRRFEADKTAKGIIYDQLGRAANRT